MFALVIYHAGHKFLHEKFEIRRYSLLTTPRSNFVTITQKPKGIIRYIQLAVSHPTALSPSQTSKIIMEVLPELKSQHDGDTKIGQYCDTKSMKYIDINALAIDSFGKDFANKSSYTYRTIKFSIDGGEAKILVAYVKNKWWCFWRKINK